MKRFFLFVAMLVSVNLVRAQSSNINGVSGQSIASPPVILTDGTTIATDASKGTYFRVTLGGNRTLSAPINPVDGEKATWEFDQDGAGSRTITLDPIFSLTPAVSSVTLSTAANSKDFMYANYNATVNKWYVVSFSNGTGGGAVTSVNGQTGAVTTVEQPVYSTNGHLVASKKLDSSGNVTTIEIFPQSTDKPDEGVATTTGTIAWAAAQLTHGGEIYVHNGNYNVATTITLGVAGTNMVCESPYTTVIQGAGTFNGDMFRLGYQGAQRWNIGIQNCSLNGNPAAQTLGTLIHVRDVAHGYIEHNNLLYWKSFGIVLDATVGGNTNNFISYNHIFGGGPGPAIETANAGADSTDNTIDYNEIGGSINGNDTAAWVEIDSGYGLHFDHNHISGPGHTIGLDIVAPGNTNMMVNDNEIENTDQHGLYFSAYQSSILNNQFYAVGQSASGTYDAIEVNNATQMNIAGNNVMGFNQTRDGIRLMSGTTETVIYGNDFRQLTGNGITSNSSSNANNTYGGNQYQQVGGTISDSGVNTRRAIESVNGPSTQTTLNGAITTSTNPITVVSTSGYPSQGTLMVDSELMTYTASTSTTFTVTRAAYGSTAATHASGAKVVLVSTLIASSPTTAPEDIITKLGQHLFQTGSSSAPSVAFQSDPSTGFSYGGGSNMQFYMHGSQVLTLYGGGAQLTGVLNVNGAGSATAPSIFWNGDNNSGLFHLASGQIGISSRGAQSLLFGDGGLYTGSSSNKDTAGQLTLASGTASYTFTGTYASAPICTASDTTATNPVRVTTSTTSLTLTGTGTDVVNYICVGRN